jgi:hypothetical protein
MRYHTDVTLIGLRLLGIEVGLSALGIADNIAKNNSLLVSPDVIHSYKNEHTSLAILGFYKRTFNVGMSNPKYPGEAETFIRDTYSTSSETVIGSFKHSTYSTSNFE